MALSPSQKTLLTRTVSAIAAVLILIALYVAFQINGLRFTCYFAVVFGTRELIRILFSPEDSLILRCALAFLILAVFSVSIFYPENTGLALALAGVFQCCFALFFEKRFANIDALAVFLTKCFLGFFYLGLLPSFAYRLFNFSAGLAWFAAMLMIVFAGDTFAYLTGQALGKTKLMPSISPKKTLEGALGGLVGSIIMAMVFSYGLGPAPLWFFALMGACVGIVAQLGDLFESLLKRVANRKDSGTLMPGHGGVLDRLDGVLFAAPVIFFFAQLIDKHLI